MEKILQIIKPNPEAVHRLVRILKCHPVTAAILYNRNILTAGDAIRYFKPSFHDLHSPFALAGVDLAVDRIYRALIHQESILVFGDYDLDGISATTLMVEFLSQMGARVTYYIPHREEEGYGFQPAHVEAVAICNRIDLIITVDCGTHSHQAVARAASQGIDTIITDHHEPGQSLPAALAVINPKRPDCEAGLEFLSGVGVAFFLLICLRAYLREKGFWTADRPEPNLKESCDLVALGTVADLVPLVEDNRIMTRVGLDVITRGQRVGLDALMAVSKLKNRPVDAEDIAFKLAPRLNAAGRMAHSRLSVELLRTRDRQEAARIARELDQLNVFRRATEQEIMNQILARIDNSPALLEKRALVLADQLWPLGVLGIVAARLVQRFNHPVILFGRKNGLWVGSGRSIPGLDLFQCLTDCESHILQFGGHAAAAGLSVRVDQMEAFQAAFSERVQGAFSSESFIPRLLLDYELNFDEIRGDILGELESLKPHGQENAQPLFLTKNVRVASSCLLGGAHRKMVLYQEHRRSHPFEAIQFGVDGSDGLPGMFRQMAYRIDINQWGGSRRVQLTIEYAC